MGEENVATEQNPAEESQGAESPAEETTETQETTEAAPQFVTAEQMQEFIEQNANQMKTWIGRRDKETFEAIGNRIDEIKARPAPDNDEMSTRLLENPTETVTSIMESHEREKSQKNQSHINKTLTVAGNVMDSDTLYKDKDLGKEVTAEVKLMFNNNQINMNVNPEEAGRLLIADALSSVMRKRQGIKTNPLENNQPQNTAGTITPGSGKTRPVKVPKLDPEAAALAKKWNMKEEDLVRVLGDENS